jgi:hypothetical protein
LDEITNIEYYPVKRGPIVAWQAVGKEGVGKWVPDAAGTVGGDGTFFSLTVYCPVAD